MTGVIAATLIGLGLGEGVAGGRVCTHLTRRKATKRQQRAKAASLFIR
jgi:hypothetical protein